MTLASALVSNPTLFLGFVALLGLLVGSFINVIVYRLPIMLERAWQSSELPTEAFNLAVPRSHCPSFAWFLLALSLIDLDHHLLPDDLTLPLLWLGLLVSAFNLGLPGVSLFDAVIGAAAGYMTLWSLFWAFLLVTGKEGLGYGDFKLLAALGAWLGWQAILPVLLLASLAGAVIGLILIVFGGRERSAPLPFGPFLAAAGFVMLIWGPQALALYGTLFAPH